MVEVKTIGLIVEDDSDFETIKILIQRITNSDSLSFKKRKGDGCGRIRRKCEAWSNELLDEGCEMLVIIHDLDDNNLDELKVDLEKKLKSSRFKNRLLCIPIEELEAWFFSDPDCIRKVFNLRSTPKFKGLPENIRSPKEELGRHIKSLSSNKRTYLNTIHNTRLAKELSINATAKKCPSFAALYSFVTGQNFYVYPGGR